jgi:hypothetical protein
LVPQLRAQLLTYHHQHPSLQSFNSCKKRLKSQLILFASHTVLSRYCPLEQEEAAPIWRILE